MNLSSIRLITLLGLVALVCYGSDWAAQALTIPPDYFALFWPATPFLVAVLLLSPRSIWPALFTVGLAAIGLCDLQRGIPVSVILCYIIADAVELLVAAMGIRWLLSGMVQLGTADGFAKYTLITAVIASFTSAVIGASVGGRGTYWLRCALWFFSDALAFLTVTPSIWAWAHDGRDWAKNPHNHLELAALMIFLVVCGLPTFTATRQLEPALMYSLVPVLLWATVRLGLKGASTSLVLVSLLSIWGTSHGRGPFFMQGPLQNVLSLQLFLFFAAAPFMALAVVVEEHKQDQKKLTEEAVQLRGTQTVLRESQQRFRLVANTAPVLIWMAGPDKLCNYFNQPWLEFTGRALEEELGDGWASGVHSDDLQTCIQIYGAAFDRREPFSREYRLRRQDGQYRWILDKGIPRSDANGCFSGYIGSAIDVTERKKAEQDLHQREKELLEAQRVAQVGSWQWDPNTDEVVWSKELYRIAGRDPSLPPPGYTEQAQLYATESWERLKSAVARAMQAGTPYKLDLELIRPDGTTRWIIDRGEVQRDALGRIVRLRGTAQDITEQKHTEEALLESEERLRMAVQAGRMYAFEWNVTTDMVHRSGECAHILSWLDDPSGGTGSRFFALVHPDDREAYRAIEATPTPENPTYKVSYRLVRPEGDTIWLEESGRAFFDECGRITREFGMVADITVRKRAEELLLSVNRRLIEAQEQERVRIARDLHDDINQRLALVGISVEQIKNAVLGSSPELLGRMDELSNQIADIACDIQAMSHRLHSSKLEYLGIVAAMKSYCKEFAEQQKVEVCFSHDDISRNVSQDVSLCLFRVAQEALQNAVKHSGVRSVEVQLRIVSGQLQLSIRDAGVGFDPETAKSNRGLGLVSMRERVSLVNGTISIATKPKGGTEVLVRVPVNLAADLNQKSASA